MSNVASITAKQKAKNATNVRVGQNVRYIMGVRDVNQVQIAIELGLTESQISRRLSGSVDWTPEDLENASRVLGVSITRLFTLELPAIDEVGPAVLETATSTVESRQFDRPVVNLFDRKAS